MSAGAVAIRRARAADLPAIVALIADDALARTRDRSTAEVRPGHRAAFDAVERDPNQFLAVAVREGEVVGCFQLTFIPGLSKNGALRGQIETVRVAAPARNAGVGRQMMEWAVEECRRRGCALVQLTTDKSRKDAHRFYERLGFHASHEGMKLFL